jgi:nucleoid-associated protein YgaU
MQFWLRQGYEFFWLPVPPAEFSIQKGRNNTTVVVEELGEINLIGSSKLAAITISSIFPKNYYNFCQYRNLRQPYYCVRLIEKWIARKSPIGLLITDTNINMDCTVESFTYGEKDGTGDVYFTLQLKQYRAINTKNTSYKRPITKVNPLTYTIEPGDFLIQIAKKFLGDGDRWREIYNKNKDILGKYPNSIRSGQVIKL